MSCVGNPGHSYLEWTLVLSNKPTIKVWHVTQVLIFRPHKPTSKLRRDCVRKRALQSVTVSFFQNLQMLHTGPIQLPCSTRNTYGLGHSQSPALCCMLPPVGPPRPIPRGPPRGMKPPRSPPRPIIPGEDSTHTVVMSSRWCEQPGYRGSEGWHILHGNTRRHILLLG